MMMMDMTTMSTGMMAACGLVGLLIVVFLGLGIAASIALSATPARGVILYRTDVRNKTAPTGTDANSGWQWEGKWAGGFVGTPIAPHYFLSASHLGGGVGGAIYFNGKNYNTTAAFDDPSDNSPLLNRAVETSSTTSGFTRPSAVGPTADARPVSPTVITPGWSAGG